VAKGRDRSRGSSAATKEVAGAGSGVESPSDGWFLGGRVGGGWVGGVNAKAESVQ